MIIVFGICLSLFTITSYESLSISDQVSTVATNQPAAESDGTNQPELKVEEKKDSQREQKLKTHRNFIASYFLQESSVRRESKKSGEQGNFIGKIVQLHKIIFSNTIGTP